VRAAGDRARRQAGARRAGPRRARRAPGRPAGRPLLPAADTLAGRASRALGWTFVSNAIGRLGTLGIGILLARLLGPHAFGTYAVAWVFLLAVLSFNDVSLSLAIVRWPGDPKQIAPTVTTMSLITSLIVYAGCFAGAPGYARAMGAPAAASVIRVLALNVLLDGLVATPNALLQRHFRQDRKMIADQVNNWLGAGVSVVFAVTGFGAMSLALGRITGAVAAAVLYVAFSPQRLRAGFDRSIARALLKYSVPLAGSAVVVFAVSNLDQLVIGRMLGATALGYYVLAFNLAAWPVNIFSQPVRSVAPAAFARLQHDHAAMRTGFLSAAAILGIVALPVCLVISGSAVPMIGFAYGARWLPAAQALAWLGLLAALRIFFELTYDFFVVLARARAVFTVQLGWFLALIPALIAGARLGGIDGVAIGEVAVAAGVILPWYLSELARVGISPAALGARLWLPLAGAVLTGVGALGLARAAPDDLTALIVSGIAGLAVMGLLGYRMRAVIAVLRPATAPPAGAGQQATGQQAATGQPAATAQLAGAGPAAAVPPAAVVRAGPLLPDITGPLPAYQDAAALPVPWWADEPAPLYRQTVAFLRWDPATTAHRGYEQPGGGEPAS
jgi:PST family polysaccharide transporter